MYRASALINDFIDENHFIMQILISLQKFQLAERSDYRDFARCYNKALLKYAMKHYC